MGEKNFKVSAGDAAAALSQLYWHQNSATLSFSGSLFKCLFFSGLHLSPDVRKPICHFMQK